MLYKVGLTFDNTLLISMRFFSRMLIAKVHKSIIVMNSIGTRFSRNVFEAVQKPRRTCFIGFKITRRTFFKHYLIRTSVLRFGFSVLRAPKITSPSINGVNPISLCQTFKAFIPAARTVFYDNGNSKDTQSLRPRSH